MGVHEWISIPLRSITMPNGRQHIISTSCCKHCGERNDYR